MGQETLLQPGNEEHGLQIMGKTLANARADDLDGNLLLDAVLQHHCGMDLRNRGSSDRVAEMGVEFGNRTAERGLDGGACFGNRKRRHAILQEGQILGKFGADHIRAGGQELADLYVGGAGAARSRGPAGRCGLLAWRDGAQKDPRRIARLWEAAAGLPMAAPTRRPRAPEPSRSG